MSTRAPGYDTPQPSRAAHDDEVVIYVNDVVAMALASTAEIREWPVGSIIVKEGFGGGDLGLIAISEKQSDGTWFWAEYADDGDVLGLGVEALGGIGDSQIDVSLDVLGVLLDNRFEVADGFGKAFEVDQATG